MPENQIAVYTDGNPFEVMVIEVTLSNATFTLWGGPQLFFNFDERPPDTPLYGFQLGPSKVALVGKMNGASSVLGVTSDDDTVDGTVSVSPALSQTLFVKVGTDSTFELAPGMTSGEFSLAFPGDDSPRPSGRALSPEVEGLLRSVADAGPSTSAALADANVDILTTTSTADVTSTLWLVELTNGVVSYFDHQLPAAGAFIGAATTLIGFFPASKSFALTAGVQELEVLVNVESGDKELRGELKLPPNAKLAAPLTLATLLAGGSYVFPAGSTGGTFSLPFGGGTLAAAKLRALRRTAEGHRR